MFRLFIFLPLLLASLANSAESDSSAKSTGLDPKLTVFKAFWGTWEASFSMESGKEEVQDVATWQRALNGKALKIVHSINDGVYGGESFIFWDKKTQQYKSFYFTTANFYTEAEITITGPKSFSVLETVTGGEEGISGGISQVKSTSTLVDSELHITTSYLKQGKWTKPTRRIYRRSNKQPKFK